VVSYFLENYQHELLLLKRENSDFSWIPHNFNSRCRYLNIEGQVNAFEFLEEKIDAILHLATDYGRGQNDVLKVLDANLFCR